MQTDEAEADIKYAALQEVITDLQRRLCEKDEEITRLTRENARLNDLLACKADLEPLPGREIEQTTLAAQDLFCEPVSLNIYQDTLR